MAGAAGWSVEECNRLIREWLKLYKGAAQYFADVEAQVLRTGEVRDCWGMVRYLPAVWSDDEKVAAEARRQAVNHRIQGGAQGMIQRAMVYLRPQVRSIQDMGIAVKWCLQVHDALLLRVPEEAVEIVQPLVESGMVEGCGKVLRVPVVVDSHTAQSWGEL
jgi:DNA polymerase I-like protein with 3'-5' exonuclease and polymerase domains